MEDVGVGADFFASALGSPDSPVIPRARVFVTGANTWTDLNGWPLPVERRTLWLASGGRANTRRGDGELRESGPDGDADEYTYNPEHPVGWQPIFRSFADGAGSLRLDEGHATGRDDVLVYTTEPAGQAWTLAGHPRLELWAQTDAADTDCSPTTRSPPSRRS